MKIKFKKNIKSGFIWIFKKSEISLCECVTYVCTEFEKKTWEKVNKKVCYMKARRIGI